MLKLISLMKRKEGMTKEEFVRWATVDHAPFAREIPGLRKYVVNVAVADDAPFDAANEMWFDDEDARAAGFGSDSGKAAGADAAAHTSERIHLKTSEHPQF